MSGRYLLDTNVAIGVLNREIDLDARRGSGLETFLCLPVVGELLYGAACSGRPEENRERLGGLIGLCPMLPQDFETARRYASVKAALRRMGRPIPENDLWIAACALRHGLILASRDSHFEAVDGLTVESW